MNALRRHRREVVIGIFVVMPLLLVAVVLLGRPWVPVLDMAMTEFRVRDVGSRHSPLIGLPGRIGTFPDQGSHPGPWSFWIIAPFYRLAGSTAWGMELGSIVVNAACVIALVWLGARRYGTRGAVVFAALAALAVRGYGLTVLSHPWNPYFPVLLWLLALVAAWFCLCGDHWMAVITVTASTIAAQTHVPYLVSAVALDALVLGVLLWRSFGPSSDGDDGLERPLAPLVTMLAVAASLWVLPLVDQVRRSPGNLTKLIRHFTTEQPEPSLGLAEAALHVLRHFDIFTATFHLFTDDDAFIIRSGDTEGFAIGGLVLVVGWLASVAWAWRHRHRDLLAMHAVVATTLLAAWVSISRIFGKLWFYLTRCPTATE